MDEKTNVIYSNFPIGKQNNSVNLFDEYAKLKQENEDYKLMLKALANGWVVWLNEGVWWWGYFAYDDDGDKVFSIESTQSDIPEINDELREEFRKI